MLEGWAVAAANIMTLLGAVVQGGSGLGFSLTVAPVLLLLNPLLVPAPVLMNVVLLCILVTVRERRTIDVRGVGIALTGRIVGTVIGAGLLAAVPAEHFAYLFGCLLIAAALMSATRLHLRAVPTTLLGAGLLSGIIGTTTSAGGPPIGLVYQRHSGPVVRGTLAGFFLIGACMSLAALHVVGRFGSAEFLAGLQLMPGVLVGFVISGRVARLLDGGYTRVAILVISFTAGGVVLLRQLI